MTKGIVYYSDCRPDRGILQASRDSIARLGLPIVAVTLQPIDWPGATCLVLEQARGYLTMFRQILAGLEALTADVAFLCEHDVLYHPSHFEFNPPRPDCYFYDLRWIKVEVPGGRALHYRAKQTAFLCACRALLIQHYRRRVALCEEFGFSRRMGFEPGSHQRQERVDDVPSACWYAPCPSLDIRHAHNLTQSRWSQNAFRDQSTCDDWRVYPPDVALPGWGPTTPLTLASILDEA